MPTDPTPTHPTGDDLPPEPRRISRPALWLAIVATVVAAPLVVIDNLPGGDDVDEEPVADRSAATTIVEPDRPDAGPPKGISVVTSSTTSSTVPLTTTITTIPPP